MKKKEKQDLQGKTREELITLAGVLKTEIIKLRMDMPMGKVKNMNEAKTKMKNRARLLTMIGMKKVEAVVKKA